MEIAASEEKQTEREKGGTEEAEEAVHGEVAVTYRLRGFIARLAVYTCTGDSARARAASQQCRKSRRNNSGE